MLSELYASAKGAKAPPPLNASVSFCDISMQYYAEKNIHTIVPTL
jgi:hypothetical protein